MQFCPFFVVIIIVAVVGIGINHKNIPYMIRTQK